MVVANFMADLWGDVQKRLLSTSFHSITYCVEGNYSGSGSFQRSMSEMVV